MSIGTGRLHVWRVQLDAGPWPDAERLPAGERERAAGLHEGRPRARWVASRWALRGVLGRYLECEPAAVELRLGERGKPRLVDDGERLRFNLSHSGGLALIAVAAEVEVGVDVQRAGKRPRSYYEQWVRREAVAKCHGVGLWAPLPGTPVALRELEIDPGFAAAVAVAAEAVPAIERREAAPDLVQRQIVAA